MIRPPAFLLSAVLGCGGVLALATPAQAQHGHGGHGHGHAGHGHGHGGHGHGHAGHGHGWGHGHSWGHGHYYHGHYGHRHYYPYWGYYGYPSYAYGGYYYPRYIYSSQPAYVVPQETVIVAKPAVPTNVCDLRVILPNADAEVWIDGKPTTSRGMTRVYETPPLEPGKTFSYILRASWVHEGRTVTEERSISAAAGKESVADFTRPPAPEKIGEPIP